VLSTLHTPSNPLERARVEQAGGYQILVNVSWVLNVGNVPRIQGKLAVSRAFGNHTIRKFLTSDPDVVTYKRDPDDIALIIATDGLWNVHPT
jgi:serine/threonine protein phosphatase PrpC